MTKKQFGGQVREITGALSAAATVWGVMSEAKGVALAGLLVSLAMLFWGIANKEGSALLMSAVRKAMGAAGAAAVVFGFLTPERVEVLIGALLPVIAMWSSFRSNGEVKRRFHAGGLPIVLFLAVLSLGLPSCAIRLDESGEVSVEVDPEAVQALSGPVVIYGAK